MSTHTGTLRRSTIIEKCKGKCHSCSCRLDKPYIHHLLGLRVSPIIDSAIIFKKEKKHLVAMCRKCSTLAFHKINRLKQSEHGEYSYYVNNGCRCVLCTKANAIQCRALSRSNMINSDLMNVFYEAGKEHHKVCTCGNDNVCQEWFNSSDSVKRIKAIFRIIT